VFGGLVYGGYPVAVIHDKFLQLATAALIFSIVFSIFLYIKACMAPKDQLASGGNSGKYMAYKCSSPHSCSDNFHSMHLGVGKASLNNMFVGGNMGRNFTRQEFVWYEIFIREHQHLKIMWHQLCKLPSCTYIMINMSIHFNTNKLQHSHYGAFLLAPASGPHLKDLVALGMTWSTHR